MYLVRFVNFAYSKPFETLEKAISHMERAGFETVLTDANGTVLGEYSIFSGFRQK